MQWKHTKQKLTIQILQPNQGETGDELSLIHAFQQKHLYCVSAQVAQRMAFDGSSTPKIFNIILSFTFYNRNMTRKLIFTLG